MLDFGGTFTKSQLERFRRYTQDQLTLIDSRIQHLKAEIARIGLLTVQYDQDGIPTGYTVDSVDTYCGRLTAAYLTLGGDIEYDLQVRSAMQPVFRLAGTVQNPSQLMNNGEVIGTKGLNDGATQRLITLGKEWTYGDLDRRRLILERKIRRCIDYSEQMNLEISELTVIKGPDTLKGSLEWTLVQIDALVQDPQYFAAMDDTDLPDPHGKYAKAPVARYTPQGAAKSQSFQRTIHGVRKPEQ